MHRFEEAAGVRDRAQALAGAIRRQRMIDHLRRAERVELTIDGIRFEFDHGRLLHSGHAGELSLGLPLGAPDAVSLERAMPRHAVDETLCIARYLDSCASRVELHECSGEWAETLNRLPSFEPKRQIRERVGRESSRRAA